MAEPRPPTLALAWYMEEPGLVRWLAARLSEAYSGARVELLGETVLPQQMFDPARGQWLSNQVLAYAMLLRERLAPWSDALLLVVGGDAYVPGLNFVFGQAMLGAGVAVVYTERLRPEFYGEPGDEELLRVRLLKEALHELGHGFGLEHCPNPRCVMSFSNSILEVDRKEPRYCSRCAKKLLENGVPVDPRYVLPG